MLRYINDNLFILHYMKLIKKFAVHEFDHYDTKNLKNELVWLFTSFIQITSETKLVRVLQILKFFQHSKKEVCPTNGNIVKINSISLLQALFGIILLTLPKLSKNFQNLVCF